MIESKHRRILLTLVGDIFHNPSAGIKYGLFHAALERRYGRVATFDATLSGLPRIANALRMFHPNPSKWRERFWKNIPAFRARSRLVANALRDKQGGIDVVLQLGVLFNAGLYQSDLPVVIYTDYTASLSATRPEAGRSPFTPQQRAEWLALEGQSYARAAHIFVRSELVRQSIISDYAIEADRVAVVGGGVNFAALPDLTSRAKNNNAPVILFIGKEFYRKGGDILLSAFAKARQQFPSAQLKMITEGPVPAEFSLDHVEIIQPTWDRDVIEKLFKTSDIFVLPSRLETWGDVLLEAMAWGLPCIGVQGDAMNEIILDCTTGLLVPPADADSLSEALLDLLQHPSRRVEMGNAGRDRVDKIFTWDQVVANMEKVL